MKKLIVATLTLSLTACGDSHTERTVEKVIIQQVPSDVGYPVQPPMMPQPIIVQQPVVQPIYPQPAYQQPPVVNSGGHEVAAFAMGAAAGAIAHHLVTADNDKVNQSNLDRGVAQPAPPILNPTSQSVEQKKNYMDMQKLAESAKKPVIPVVTEQKKSALDTSKLSNLPNPLVEKKVDAPATKMDMGRLSGSVVQPVTTPVQTIEPKKSGLDMSRLSSKPVTSVKSTGAAGRLATTPNISVGKPVSKMDMSKMGKK